MLILLFRIHQWLLPVIILIKLLIVITEAIKSAAENKDEAEKTLQTKQAEANAEAEKILQIKRAEGEAEAEKISLIKRAEGKAEAEKILQINRAEGQAESNSHRPSDCGRTEGQPACFL